MQLDLFSLTCETCGAYMVPTPGGLLCCPRGHGRLQLGRPDPVSCVDSEPEADEACGRWFDSWDHGV